MPNVLERQQDILSIISELDISPTMYNNFDAYEFLKQDLSLIEYTLYKVRKGKE